MMNSIYKRVWKHKQLSLVGNSTAGISTSFVCPELGVAFDVAQGLPWAYTVPYYLITHSHMDHAAGIPYIISQKALTGQRTPQFYMHPSMVEPMKLIMRTWEQIEGHQYQYQFTGVETGVDYPLKGALFFRAFPTVHRVSSQGYCIYKKRKNLKNEFKTLHRQQLVELREKGVELEQYFSEPLLAFTGDTQIEFLDLSEDVKSAQILVMEVT